MGEDEWVEEDGPPIQSRRGRGDEVMGWAEQDPNFRKWRAQRSGGAAGAAVVEEDEDDPLNPRIFQRAQRRRTPDPPSGIQWGLVFPIAAVVVLALLAVVAFTSHGGSQQVVTQQPSDAAAGGARSGDTSAFSTPPTITPTAELEAGWVILPAMDDAADRPFNGQLIHLDEQPAFDMNVWSGNEGALCQYRLKDQREVWVPCWRMDKPNATPVPQPTRRPPPPTPTPAPPCFHAKGLNGEFERCGWDVSQADVDTLAGPTIAPPAPTMCASSDDGTVQMCGGTDMEAMRKEANWRANAQRAATATAQATAQAH